LSPLVLVYALVGWGSPSRIFAPVQLVRGLVVQERTDGSIDRSKLYRDIENYNLVTTFRSNPLLGTGFGHPFGEAVKADDLSAYFKEYAYLPHNSVLGLWAFTGAVGFSGIFMILVVTLFLAARAHAHATRPDHAIAATASISVIGAYVIQLWGDIGFTEAPAIFLVGLAVAVAGQLATETGAWPRRRRKARAALR
jgi:O-antigen ligase